MESNRSWIMGHGKFLRVDQNWEFKSMELYWTWTPKKVTLLISVT